MLEIRPHPTQYGRTQQNASQQLPHDRWLAEALHRLVAVLAALNIADECARLRADVREADGRASGRAAALARELAAALDEK